MEAIAKVKVPNYHDDEHTFTVAIYSKPEGIKVRVIDNHTKEMKAHTIKVYQKNLATCSTVES